MRRIVCLAMLAADAMAQSHEKRITPVDPAARQTFERQPKIAVLVGIGMYPEGSGLSPLKYPAQDVADLAAEFEKQGYAVRQLTDGQASRGLVVRTLTQIGRLLDPDKGTLLFYFSGHGFAEKGINYLATYGVTVDDLSREGLSLDEVERLVKSSRAKRQMLWIDACRNDPGAGAREVSRRTFTHWDAAEGMRVLYSTRSGNVSYEDDSLKHGVFTYFLLRGLRGEAAGGDGLVTFQDLAGYVSNAVMNYGVRTGRIQKPFDAGEASGDFLLGKAAVQPYAGPKEGRIVWTGTLEAGKEIDLAAQDSSGSVSGALPGVPVSIEVHPASVRVVTPPSAENQWNHLVVKSDGKKQVVILVRWTVIQP